MDVAIEMQISMGTLNNWLKRYQLEGTEGLHPKRDNQVKENGKEEFARLRIIEKKYYEAQEDIEILKKFRPLWRRTKSEMFRSDKKLEKRVFR